MNDNFRRLLDKLQLTKVYIHSLHGEPFGISTLEAISGGIIPIVACFGRCAEFVPLSYEFKTFNQGVEAMEAAFDAPISEFGSEY